ncbi:hypothetical protein A3Q56_03076 [Intoshia linei]|uniref:Segment polarity protein dishevelled DVL-3 n=1 Tax=Intoshia linei TaxID=1819745 RepID=A0A177B4G1_9BILA|nr:hypothetical protein A3Q56_03076 [Intoshia linei]
MTSMTDTNNSLKVIKVTLDMDFYKFLGISIVGQSDEHSDGGIYVGSIRKDGAVYKNGRIDPGDMILEVNNIYFGNINNNKAVNYLREAVEKGGKLTLMVAKCWNDGAVDFSQSEQMDDEIETSAWTQQSRILKNKRHSISLKSSTASLTSSLPETDFCGLNLTSNTDMTTIIKAMCQPNSGLIIRNRSWLKLSIPNSVIGSDVVDWLYTNVDGFVVRKDAKKYAASLLKYGYIIHSVDKPTFSEQCYYTFNTSVSDLSIMTNENFENSICSPWNISYKNPQIFNAHNKDKPEINIKSKYLVGKETTCSCIMKPNYKKIYNKIIPKALMSESKDKKNIDKRVDSSSSDDFYSTYSYCDSFENKEKNFKKNDESINLTKKHTKDKCVNPNKYYYNQHQTSVANYTYQSNLPKLVSSDSNFNDSCNENVNIKSNLQGFDSALENLTQPSKYISLENAKFTNVL